MIRHLCTLAVLALALVLAPLSARAADGPGTKVVRQANDAIAALLKQKAPPGSEAEKKAAAKVTTSVRDFLDIELLTRRALVDHWAKLSEAQKKDFLDTLRALIEDNYVKGLRANLDYTVTYLGESPGAESTLVVKTQIAARRKGRPVKIAVDYVLVQQGGKWRCFDVKTDGVGLVDNYRAQFNKIIAKDGFDGLLAKMKKKRASK
jgi:phospholipid transport system substrate-binding protein